MIFLSFFLSITEQTMWCCNCFYITALSFLCITSTAASLLITDRKSPLIIRLLFQYVFSQERQTFVSSWRVNEGSLGSGPDVWQRKQFWRVWWALVRILKHVICYKISAHWPRLYLTLHSWVSVILLHLYDYTSTSAQKLRYIVLYIEFILGDSRGQMYKKLKSICTSHILQTLRCVFPEITAAEILV